MTKGKIDKPKFIDLFAGIGGFRLGFERAGYECVFGAEKDDHACSVYEANYGHNPKCDITELNAEEIPDFDVLCAGFPCQAFSISGKQKGFNDTRGTLFFDICRIIEVKRPIAFVLENVENLEKHDNGKTFKIMYEKLINLGYTVNYKVLNAKDFDVPQNRNRIIIVGNRDGRLFDFNLIKKSEAISMKDYLDEDNEEMEYLGSEEYTLIDNYKKQQKSGLIFIGYRNKNIRTTGVRPNTEHLSRVHKQPNRIYSSEGMHPTIASQETAGRYLILNNGRVRKLTLNECFRFMGFPDDFKKIGQKTKLYERIGNSVCVNLIESVASSMYIQFFSNNNRVEHNPMQFLQDLYMESYMINYSNDINLDSQQKQWISDIVDNKLKYESVYKTIVASLAYKCINKEQDIRFHKIELDNGYSGIDFDTNYTTPFLKLKGMCENKKDSGWNNKSIDKEHPFTLDFPGRINNIEVKNAFLQILNDVEVNNQDANEYLKAIFSKTLIKKYEDKYDLNNNKISSM